MTKEITSKVKWVGKVDWQLRTFHGEELSTHRGSSYNAFLIKDEKIVLMDTVWKPYDKEFVENLKKEIDLKKIDYIVINHGETDHTGALPALMREIPDTPIYCTANAVKSLTGHYHENWNFVPVKTGDTLDLGESKLVFIEARMLHWPDTMFTYMTGENILFSTDGFGQHFASESLYNDLNSKDEIMFEALKYYANILAPFSPIASKKINEILSMNLPISMICPSHGIIWRDNPMQIVDNYIKWSNIYAENQVTIVYDTMWESTRKMAEAIAHGIYETDKDVTVKLFNAGKSDKNDIITEIFRSKAVLFGSPTVNNGYLHSIAGLLELVRGMKLKNKKAAVFGSYGWSGESVKLISENLRESGFDIVNEGLRITWAPDNDSLSQCMEFGSAFADAVR